MKKLTDMERAALYFLNRDGPICPGDAVQTEAGQIVKSVFDSLVKKKRANVEMTDDGPSYSISAIGRQEVARG
jgi:hypothetical protein